MTCPTITTLHAILAAYDAPAGPSKADTLKAVAECLSGACAAAATDLHAAIMNIPADHAKACGTNNAPAYKIGHRDARHAAAELAIQAQPVAAQGRDKLLTIIASAYQIAGHHDAPEHILDVLADPEAATEAQVEAMLPYQPEETIDLVRDQLVVALTAARNRLTFANKHIDCADEIAAIEAALAAAGAA